MTGTEVVVHSASTSNGSDVFSRICYVIIFGDRTYSGTSSMTTSQFHAIFILAILKVPVPALCLHVVYGTPFSGRHDSELQITNYSELERM